MLSYTYLKNFPFLQGFFAKSSSTWRIEAKKGIFGNSRILRVPLDQLFRPRSLAVIQYFWNCLIGSCRAQEYPSPFPPFHSSSQRPLVVS